MLRYSLSILFFICISLLYANDSLEQGRQYLQEGQYQKAVHSFDQALRDDPTLVEVYAQRGYAYSQLGKYKQAIPDYTQAIAVQPKAIYYYNRAIGWLYRGDFVSACDDLDIVIKQQPQWLEAYFNRGVAQRRQQHYALAIADFDYAIQHNANYVRAYYNRCLTYLEWLDDKLAGRPEKEQCLTWLDHYFDHLPAVVRDQDREGHQALLTRYSQWKKKHKKEYESYKGGV